MIEGDVIECCMHMGSFHIPTGMVMQPPCEVPLRTYQVVLRYPARKGDPPST